MANNVIEIIVRAIDQASATFKKVEGSATGITSILFFPTFTGPQLSAAVEDALAAASDHGDLSVLERLLSALAKPYTDRDDEYTCPPPASTTPYRTFCGT